MGSLMTDRLGVVPPSLYIRTRKRLSADLIIQNVHARIHKTSCKHSTLADLKYLQLSGREIRYVLYAREPKSMLSV